MSRTPVAWTVRFLYEQTLQLHLSFRAPWRFLMGADNPGPTEGKDALGETIGPTVFGTPDMENPPVTRPDEFTPHQRELYNRLGWFIQFRWIGLGGFCIGLLYTLCVLGSSKMLGVLFLLVAVASAYNLLFVFINHRLRRLARPSRGKIISFALLQISVDLIALSGIVHYTGGIDSVFVVCYVFHMVVASVLLRPWLAFLVAGLASAMLDGMTLLEATGRIAHHSIEGFSLGHVAAVPDYLGRAYLPCVFMNAAFFLMVYVSSSISQRLRRRERQIRVMNAQLEEVSRAKAYLMRVASHEMQSPLFALQGLFSILRERLAKQITDSETTQILQRCTARLESLQELVVDLLHYSRLQAVEAVEHTECFNLGATVARAVDELGPVAEARQINLNLDMETCRIQGDQEEILCLVKNLVANALRYTLNSGSVRVCLKQSGNEGVLEVEDNGIGIDAASMNRIFEEFFRAPNAKAHEPGGTGLGLTLCKRIAENHGGVIHVASNLNEGTTFTVRLPLADA